MEDESNIKTNETNSEEKKEITLQEIKDNEKVSERYESSTPLSKNDMNGIVRKIPIEKIKKSLAVVLIFGLIGVIVISMLHAMKQPEIVKSIPKVEKETNPLLEGTKSKVLEGLKVDYGIDPVEKENVKNNIKSSYDPQDTGYLQPEERFYNSEGDHEKTATEEMAEEFEKSQFEEELRARNSSADLVKKEQNIQQSNSYENTNSSYGGVINNPYSQNSQVFDQNKQDEKKRFARSVKHNEFANSFNQEYADDYTVKAGGIIPTILISGLNSDLPSNIIAQVREDVYDTVSGNYLMIPKGTRIIGTYDSGVTFGQNRLLLVWQRLVFPNGKSIGLSNFNGVDMSGYAGVGGKVNNHYIKLLQAVVLSSVIATGTAILTDDDDDKNDDWRSAAGKGAGTQMMEIGTNIAEKIMNIQPTITIKQGTRMNVMINSDLKLTPYRR